MRWAASALSAEDMPRHQNVIIDKKKILRSPYVDLDSVRRNGSDLAGLLSRNTRYQIRRAIRLYEAMGKLRIERATTREECLAWLEALRYLHQTSWTSRGKLVFCLSILRGISYDGLSNKDFVKGPLIYSASVPGHMSLVISTTLSIAIAFPTIKADSDLDPTGGTSRGAAHALAVRHYARSAFPPTEI